MKVVVGSRMRMRRSGEDEVVTVLRGILVDQDICIVGTDDGQEELALVRWLTLIEPPPDLTDPSAVKAWLAS